MGEEIQRIYSEADILVNIGNSNADFTPSKTFEYIVTGKPIVNFYYNYPDKTLENYPNVLQIQNFNKCIHIRELEDFILSYCNLEIDMDTILSIYKTNSKEYVSNILHRVI